MHEHSTRPILTIPEVAEILGIPTALAYRLGREGKAPVARNARAGMRLVRVKASDIDAWREVAKSQKSTRKSKFMNPVASQEITTNPGDFMTFGEVAEYVGVSVETVRRRVLADEIAVYSSGKDRRKKLLLRGDVEESFCKVKRLN